MYRRHHQEVEQGELSTAPSATSDTKLSQHTHTSSPTGTKLSQHTQNCPFQPVLPEQGELCTARTTTPPSRENFVPHLAPNPVQNSPTTPVLQRFREKVRPAHLKTAFFASFAPAGRIFSRSHPHQAEQGELIRAEDLTGRYDGATLKPPTPLFTVDRPRSSHRLYGRHPRPRTRALHQVVSRIVV